MTASTCIRHRSIHWFRKGLRLHDNPSLLATICSSECVWPVFILDPWFVQNYKVGENRWRFLVQCLTDLDHSLQALGGRLYVIRGNPKNVFPEYIKKWNISQFSFEGDTEPYAIGRDKEIEEICCSYNVHVLKKMSHTLYDAPKIIELNKGTVPLTYQRFQKLLSEHGPPSQPKPAPTKETLSNCRISDVGYCDTYKVPSLEELGVDEAAMSRCLYPGGESEALERMEKYLKRTNWIVTFEKPKTEPNTIVPSTTVLSPYMKFGCLSSRLFYWKIQEIYATSKKHSQPPVSLHGQLLWREFFYTVGYGTANFNKMEGNSVCRQIPWDDNAVFFEAWKNARTGYPFIDAIMTQLKNEGWIHHLARHAVACFLTRGDLWISWEKGQEVFEEWLLDADWFLNAGNWMWLSCSAFFHQYYRVYSPIAFGKKTDKSGEYIKKYIPILRKYPAEYIYEPWKAPLSVQKAAGCLIGQDYPKPIVEHDKIRLVNIDRMKRAFASKKNSGDSSTNQKSETAAAKRKGSQGEPKEKTAPQKRQNSIDSYFSARVPTVD